MHGPELYWWLLVSVATLWLLVLATVLTIDYAGRDED